MNHKAIRKELVGRIADLLGSRKLPIKLRPYQREALTSVGEWLRDPGGTPRGHIVHATGLGKTVLYGALLAACSELRSLVIVPTKTLLEQTARFVSKLTDGTMGHFSSLSKIRDEDGEVVAVRGHDKQKIVIATDASFNRWAKKLAAEYDPRLVIRDECHWAYIEAAQCGLAEFKEAVIIALSATPDYLMTAARNGYVKVTLEDGQVLYAPPDRLARTHFGTLLDERSVRWGIENGWLAPLAWGRIKFDVSLDSLPVTQGPAGFDYREDALQSLMARHWSVTCETARRLFADTANDLAARQSFAVCPSVAAAEELAEAMRSLGIPSACVSGETPDALRNKILSAYRANEIKFVSSVMVLREGWDAPNAEVCLMLRPTKSRVLYLQSMGRVLRPSDDMGPKTALVLDAYFQDTKFAPLSAPVLFSKPGEQVTDRGILIGPTERGIGSRGDQVGEASPYLPQGVKPRLVLVDTIEIEYWAGSDGTFEADGEVWGTAEALGRLLSISATTIISRAKESKIRTRTAKDPAGKYRDFYPLSEVKKACADLLEELPQAGPDGTFTIAGEPWATLTVASAILGLDRYTIHRHILRAAVSSRCGKNVMGRVFTFYPLSEVKKACADLLEELLHAGPDGTLKRNGELWGTASCIAKLLGLSEATIVRRLRRKKLLGCKGRNRTGHPATFYPLSEVKKACADLLEELPQAGKDGTFKRSGETHGTVEALSRILGISTPAIASRIAREKIRGQFALSHNRRLIFYPLSDVREACRNVRRGNRQKTKR